MKICRVWEEGKEEWTTQSVRHKQATTTARDLGGSLQNQGTRASEAERGSSWTAYQYPLPTRRPLPCKILSTEDINLFFLLYKFSPFEMESYSPDYVPSRQIQDLHR